MKWSIFLLAVGCTQTSSPPPPPPPAPEPVVVVPDAAVAPPVDAPECPACGVGCAPGQRISSKIGTNGCRMCGCESMQIPMPPEPPKKPAPHRCPACGVACTHSDEQLSSKIDENGCRVCGCEKTNLFKEIPE